MCPHKTIYTGVHRSIVINAPNWKQFKCPATGEWIKNYDISTQWNVSPPYKEMKY